MIWLIGVGRQQQQKVEEDEEELHRIEEDQIKELEKEDQEGEQNQI